MLYVDTPTHATLQALINTRAEGCVSLFLPTTPLTQDTSADRIALKGLAKQAIDQLHEAKASKKLIDRIQEEIDEIVEDDEFWKHQARSLALFLSPDWFRTFRLANHLQPYVEVADRFHLKPLLRAVSFNNHAYVLSLSENGARLFEVGTELKPQEVRLDGLPKDAASAVGKSTINDPSPVGKIQGGEGQKVRFKQYSRKIDAALRPLLNGMSVPLILASTGANASLYRSVNSYPHLVAGLIEGNPDHLSADQIDSGARKLLDEEHAAQLNHVKEVFAAKRSKGLATTEISDAARAATFGAVDTLMVDMDHEIHGTVGDSDGHVAYSEKGTATNYDVVDEIARRVINGGGRVISARQSDIPDGANLAAILRYEV